MTLSPLYPHQEEALRKLSNGKILWGGVGSGKTRVAAEYYMLKERPRDVYVITTAKKRDDFDWQKQFYELGIGPRSGPASNPPAPRSRSAKGNHREDHQDAGSGSEGVTDLLLEGDRGEADPLAGRLGRAGVYPYVLTVDSWNNIAKYADVAGAFFIFDEQRLVGSGDWTRKFLRIAKRNHWILLSATPGDTWMDYVPVFVANGFYKNRTDFKREHVVYNTFTKFPKVDRYINQGRLLRHRNALLIEMKFERHTKRRIVEVPLQYDKEMLDRVIKDRWNVYEERPLRDISEMFIVARRVVNSDPSRLEMVCELWKQHPKLIVFYNFNFELASLRSLSEYYSTTSTNSTTRTGTSAMKSRIITESSTIIADSKSGGIQPPSEKKLWTPGSNNALVVPTDTRAHSSTPSCETSSTTIAEWNGHKHQPVPTSDRWLYLVQYTAGAEGWNCTSTDAMVFYSRHYSWKVWEQAQGRIDRLNTPFKDLWYYDFMTDSMIDRAIGKALKSKKVFNERRYEPLMRSQVALAA